MEIKKVKKNDILLVSSCNNEEVILFKIVNTSPDDYTAYPNRYMEVEVLWSNSSGFNDNDGTCTTLFDQARYLKHLGWTVNRADQNMIPTLELLYGN